MDWITDLDTLHARYGTPGQPALRKVASRLTPAYRAFLDAAAMAKWLPPFGFTCKVEHLQGGAPGRPGWRHVSHGV